MSEQSVSSLGNKFGLTSFDLKWIALITMIVDHIGAVLYPSILWFRIIGRLAFPIYSFLLVEGFLYTHDVKKYMKRLLALAIVSEIPFDLVFNGIWIEFRHQNVFFTLFLGVYLMHLYQQQTEMFEKLVCVLVVVTLGDLIRSDYGAAGILMIFCFYILREHRLKKLLTVSCINIFAFGFIQSFACLAFLPIAFYNGRKGKGIQSFFYWMYPMHLIILYVVRLLK